MVVATVILLLACAAVSNCVGPDIYSDSGNPVETCHVNWTYDRTNKTHGSFCWDMFAPTCDGERQSPINIETKKVTFMFFDPKYQRNTNTLTGHIKMAERAPKFMIDKKKSSFILSGIPFHSDKRFRLMQFHMHFHEVNVKGSEHRVDCEGHDGELHFVHEEISSMNDARTSNNNAGTRNANKVVLAIFVTIDEKENKTYPGLGPFFDNLKNAVICGTDKVSGESETFTVGPLEFLTTPGNLYSYEGSLTTPTCNETVTWLVRHTPVTVSRAHFEELLKLKWENTKISVHGNVRPPFPMNDRKVYTNFKVRNEKNNENHNGNNNNENNGPTCTEWYESRVCGTESDDDDDN
uniref:Carbonic anhydrase n=1 Tax=Sinohyriopsis cumingii TaxID=165450 RepID=A0A220A4U9_SINCU|nr:carbonic anhydrase 3 [Sinohyriopsis cumingii]